MSVDHTLIGSVPAKKHEAPQSPAGHTVDRHMTLQSTAPKFGLLLASL